MASSAATGRETENKNTSMDSSFPVLLPKDPFLRLPVDRFHEEVSKTLPPIAVGETISDLKLGSATNASSTSNGNIEVEPQKSSGNAFIDALEQKAANPDNPRPTQAELATGNFALTDNKGIAHASTKSHLTDLFYQLQNDIDSDELTLLLEDAWKVDPLSTLKIIWSARSIHQGKGEREIFYRALGWLKDHHPRTFLINLPGIYRSVIEKDARSRPDDDKMVVDQGEFGLDDHEVIHGVSHGYWKDLLNILVLSAEGMLDTGNPNAILKKNNPGRPRKGLRNRKQRFGGGMVPESLCHDKPLFRIDKTNKSREEIIQAASEYNSTVKSEAKAERKKKEIERHQQVIKRLKEDSFHRALHYSVARLFADQLRKDVLLLETGSKEQLRELSLCGKWAPSLEKFHDGRTNIATTIAEILFSEEQIGQENDTRELYLKRAREQYRAKVLSPLRKALGIVERNISTNTFSEIKYNRVPSLAMDQYKSLFFYKDYDHFSNYIGKVIAGKEGISGAVLSPGRLVKQARGTFSEEPYKAATLDAQWKSLVQRIKDSGTLTDAIAICDVSDSMVDFLKDGTQLIHHSVGLSLLLAEVTKPPFGGHIISFSERPEILNIGAPEDDRDFVTKVKDLINSNWSMNTDLMKVFLDLLLPLAVENNVKQEDMVKKLFIFSDMQFDQASTHRRGEWETHHQIIEKEFAEKGYQVPEIIYWNLKYRRYVDGITNPVTHDTPGTALVSGYSQGMIKMFLENGGFEEEEEEEEEDFAMVDEEGEVTRKAKKVKDPFSMVKKAIGHKAYDILKVVD